MERVADWFQAASDWVAALPPIPPLGLPPAPDPPLLLMIATVVTGLAALGLISAWVDRRFSIISTLALLLGLAFYFWVWETDRDDWSAIRIPEAFVEMVARIVR